jgi:hypothetical protein
LTPYKSGEKVTLFLAIIFPLFIMPALISDNSNENYDLIGLGFGPANLAIAGAIVEQFFSVTTKLKKQAHTPLMIL